MRLLAKGAGRVLAVVLFPAAAYAQASIAGQVKDVSGAVLPGVTVEVSGTFQSVPGPEIAATFTATNALITPSLGRALSGGAANVSVNLVEPGTMYGDRLNQLDFRFGRAFRLGTRRVNFSLDIYNALNVDTALTLNNAFATWQRPQSIILARFAKLGMQFDFRGLDA